MPIEWKIARRERACRGCERPFDDGERHFSALFVEEGQLVRADFCRGCWDRRGAQGSDGAGSDLLWWRTRHEVERKRSVALDFEVVESLFWSLEDREEERVLELRYLLGLLLLRKRRLKILGTLRAGERGALADSFRVRRPRSERETLVRLFDLTPERMDALREDLRRILEGAGLDDGSDGAAEASVAAEGPDEAPSAETAADDAR